MLNKDKRNKRQHHCRAQDDCHNECSCTECQPKCPCLCICEDSIPLPSCLVKPDCIQRPVPKLCEQEPVPDVEVQEDDLCCRCNKG